MASVKEFPQSEQSIFKFGGLENTKSFNSFAFSASHEYFNAQWNNQQKGFEQAHGALLNQNFMMEQAILQTAQLHSEQQVPQIQPQIQAEHHNPSQPQHQLQQPLHQLHHSQLLRQQTQPDAQRPNVFLNNDTQQLELYQVDEDQFLYGGVSALESQTQMEQQLENLSQLNTIEYPLVDTFTQPSLDQVPQFQFNEPLLTMDANTRFQRARYLSEPNIMGSRDQRLEVSVAPQSTFALSPESVSFSYRSTQSSTLTIPSNTETRSDEDGYKRYKVIRGISSGGSATKPPRVNTMTNHHYSPVNLNLIEATLEDLCLPKWNEAELDDKRRIIRIERFQVGSQIVAQFSIVGAANEHEKTEPAQPGVDVVEVSCLRCYARPGDDVDEEDEEEQTSSYGYQQSNYSNDLKTSFYITSVEVIKIVELLVGTELQDAAERRRERGRIRSNLVPFWSKKPISSRMSSSELRSSPIASTDNADFRVELATRIMAYDIRKPRGFDKEVRILKWEKLVPALRRALQSYYVEIPDGFDEEADI